MSEFIDQVKKQFGDDLIECEENYSDVVIRVTNTGYKKAAKICKDKLKLDYLSFISAIDWMPMPLESEEGSGDTSQPTQPSEMTFGVCGSDSRFQVFAHVQTTSSHIGLTIKTDVDENTMKVDSWTKNYPGADWHERECWEMYGIDFAGHPEIRHLYLPGDFEGFPLRKDFPLLARVIKPWPGLVDVEPMPGDNAEESESTGA
ncbi:MAG: NADH-quinone oxidoreductase subunit C [Acidimicrobiia bacterium]